MGLIDEREMIGYEAEGPKSCEMRGEKRDNMESQSGEQNKRGSWFFAYPPCDVILFSVPFHRCSGTIPFCLASQSPFSLQMEYSVPLCGKMAGSPQIELEGLDRDDPDYCLGLVRRMVCSETRKERRGKRQEADGKETRGKRLMGRGKRQEAGGPRTFDLTDVAASALYLRLSPKAFGQGWNFPMDWIP